MSNTLIQKLTNIKTAKDDLKAAFEGMGLNPGNDFSSYANFAQEQLQPAGSGVKLFSTIAEMDADPNPQEGDLAIVYREEIQPVTEESEFSSCTFPNTVVLDEAFSGNIYEGFRAVDPSVTFDGNVEMSSSRFRFDGYGESSEIRIQYKSQDGITYTRTDGGEELQEFGTTIKWEGHGDPFNDVISNFMKIGGSIFEGLYEYKLNHKVNNIIQPANLLTSQITIENNVIKSFIVPDKLDLKISLQDLKQVIKNNNIEYSTFYIDINNKLRMISSTLFTYITDSNGNIIGLGYSYKNLSDITIYEVNLSQYTLSNPIIYQPITFTSDNITWYSITDMKSYIFDTSNSNQKYQANIIIQNTTTKKYSDVVELNVYKDMFVCAKTQLNAISDYVYEKTFYGKNGVEVGTLTTNVSNSFADVNAKVYAKIQQQYDNMQPRVLTDQDKAIDSNIATIPCKTNSTPLLDTSNVTNMHDMFNGCKSLITIPLLDTSNVTYMQGMFNGCKSLITIPLLDTSKVTNMNSMFYNCTSLIMVPQLDTSNVTYMQGMFSYCTSLTTIPLLNTSKVTNMYDMFNNCTSLIMVPQLDTSNVTNMYDMFNNCTSLNNESLNNILAMCKNAAKITSNKTLKYIGLTQEQANICKTLSNYSAFIAAGWTTGY